MAKKKKNELVTSLLYIIVGVLLIIFKGQTLNWVMTAVGAFFIVSGVLDLLRFNVIGGAINLIIGIAILVLGWAAVGIVLLVLGILIAFKGLVALIESLKRKKKNLFEILFALLSVAVGLLLAFGNGINTIILVVGIMLCVDGVLGIIGSARK